MPHSRVNGGCEKKAKSYRANRRRHLLTSQRDLDAEAFEDIGAATKTGIRPVAVLGDADACTGDDKGDHGRDIERNGLRAASPARVEERLSIQRHGDGLGLCAHGFGEAQQLIGRLAFHPQSDQERGQEWCGNFAGKNRAHRGSCVIRTQIFAIRYPVEIGNERHAIVLVSSFQCDTSTPTPMKIHEYQAKAILAKYGVPVPRGEVAFTPEEAEAAAKKLGGSVVIKAQIHAGGRGKGGGVKLAADSTQAYEVAKQILGMTLVTHQTGPEGRLVQRVLVEETLPIRKELYAGLVLDRAIGKVVFMASSEGGMEIEEVAAKTPEKILKEPIEPGLGLQPFQARKLAFGIGLPTEAINNAAKCMIALAQAYEGSDATLAEINPLVLSEDGKVIALDAKFNIDDNAMFRHKDFVDLRDLNEEDPLEVEASRYGLNYIKLDGNVACMVNGAGLAMATMDIIKYAGGSPANFLDVGGGANAEQVKNAFRILLSDAHVKAVLINIFGGILRCDTLATGVVNAARELNVQVPVVVRMEGTNVELGRQILAESGLNFTVADGMKDAAEKVVRLAQ